MNAETNAKAVIYLVKLAEIFEDNTRRLYIPEAGPGFSDPECLDIDYAEADQIAAELRQIAKDIQL